MFRFVAFAVLLAGPLGCVCDINYMSTFDLNSFSKTGSFNNQVKQLIQDDSVKISLEAKDRYAIWAPELKQFNWASVNINGEQVKIVTPNCNVIDKHHTELGQDELRVLKYVFNRQPYRQSVVSFGTGLQLFQGSSMDLESFTSERGDFSMQQVGDNHLAVSSNSLMAANIKRVFVDGDLVTFIDSDDGVRMQPKSCLTDSERQLLSGLETELAQARAEYEAKQAKRDQGRQARELVREQARQQKSAERERRQAEKEAARLERERERERRQVEKEAARLEREREREQRRQERQQRRSSGYDEDCC